MTRIKPFSK